MNVYEERQAARNARYEARAAAAAAAMNTISTSSLSLIRC